MKTYNKIEEISLTVEIVNCNLQSGYAKIVLNKREEYRVLLNKKEELQNKRGGREMEDKKELIQAIEENIKEVSDNNKAVDEIKHQLRKHGISGGTVTAVLSDPKVLEDIDMRELALITEQFYLKTGIPALDVKEWFTKYEMTEARQYDKTLYTESTDYPHVEFENASIVGNGVLVTTVSPKKIAELMRSQVLYYNPEIQRQMTYVKRNNDIIETPTVYKKNVKEIKELLLKERLVSTTIALNAVIGSSDTDEELVFDPSKNTLTIGKGTRLDILDGYHRCLASEEAYEENPDLDNFKFILQISNWTTRQCQQYQAQLAKATPIPKAIQQSLEASRLADTVVQMLREGSDIGDRISSQHRISPIAGQLVSYNVFADAVEREFPMEFRIDAMEVADWLGKFFEYLIGLNRDEFTHNSSSKGSLMSYNKMFAGYIALAAKMKEEDVSIRQLQSILDGIDFSKSNPLWQEIGVLDETGRVKSGASERSIANYFKGLELNPEIIKQI